MSDKADKEWEKAKELYRATGKTAVTRILNNIGNKTTAAKAYSKQYDKASRMLDEADKEWEKAFELYRETGKTAVSRVMNNMKYRRL